jgi:hypothetical protein
MEILITLIVAIVGSLVGLVGIIAILFAWLIIAGLLCWGLQTVFDPILAGIGKMADRIWPDEEDENL